MIERKIVQDRITEFGVDRYLRELLSDVPIKKTVYEKTPLGERITIFSSAPGLVIGREGSNIKKITEALRDEFGFKNPQVKIGEVKNPNLSAAIVAKDIANSLARFGSQRFKLTGFKALMAVMNAGAMGVEIRITGKIPSSRAKSWRFHKGYLKKTGSVSDFLVDKAIEAVTLKTGVIGIKVQIMLPNTPLPDRIEYNESYKTVAEAVGIPEENVEEVIEEVVAEAETKTKESVGDEQ
jgi:small subunit ribosomal protein S3